jgi:hypothetical protein
LKWLLGAVVLVVVVAVSVGATLLFTRGDSGENPPAATSSSPSRSSVASDIASADDTGQVGIITEDPTCAPWTPINNTLAQRENNGWGSRDPSLPAIVWTSEIRKMFAEVGDAMREAADQAVPLAKMTPHRVMRELYEQFIAYARAYDEKIPSYTAVDDHLANVAVSASLTLTYICDAADFGSAAARGPLTTPTASPNEVARPDDSAKPQRFLLSPDSICAEWRSAQSQFNTDIAVWAQTDPQIPVAQWTADQQAQSDAVTPVLRKYADNMQSTSKRSDNLTLQDFASASATYLRAYVEALPTYGPNDRFLFTTAAQTSVLIDQACLAVGG